MQEFIYYNPKGIDFPLCESIIVTNELANYQNDSFIVSNISMTNTELVANEIDFYVNNTKDPLSKKIKNIEKLYEVNALRFDLAQDMEYTQEISNKLLLICDDEQKKEVLRSINIDEFDLFHINESIIRKINGHIGNLTVSVQDDEKLVDLKVDQIIWFNEKELGTKQSGCFDPLKTTLNDVLANIRANISHFSYKKFTTYDKTICQYHERREDICGRCADVCPTVAIEKDEETKHLKFSQIDCHGCGGCVSICPSGAIDYTPSNRDTISQMSRFYENQIPLIIPNKMNISSLAFPLKEDILPFKIEGEKFLNEATLLTLLQESGSQIIFYTDFLSKGTKDSISILNQVYQAKYQKDAIIVAMNEKELKVAIECANIIDNSKYKLSDMELNKRELFAVRLSNIVQNEDLGIVKTGENVHYAQVKVNESNCTLCLSCVGACNVNAIFADASDNSLKLNASICTACGYCEVTCPEKNCLTIEQDVIKLNNNWFKEEVLAKDELFSCVECGKEFATKKAIEKIASIMAPIFSSDPIKEKTLYCCEDCKPKIMMKSYMENQDAYNNPQGVSL